MDGSEAGQYLSNNLKIEIGKLTTCAYQFLNYRNDDLDRTLFQFFLYERFNIALRIHDFACKTFTVTRQLIVLLCLCLCKREKFSTTTRISPCLYGERFHSSNPIFNAFFIVMLGILCEFEIVSHLVAAIRLSILHSKHSSGVQRNCIRGTEHANKEKN